MPEETHKWLINFESADVSATTGVDALMAKLEQLRTRIGTVSAEWDALMRRDVSQGTGGGQAATLPGVPVDPGFVQERAAGGTRDWAQALQEAGASQEFVARAQERANEFAATGIRLKDAQSRAVRETTAAFLEEGGAIERSGNWLAGYIERYLIRYFVVWQGMVAVKMVIRDWVAAHEDLDRAMFRLQTSMGMSTDQAERYMATMRQMGGGIGISGVQLAAGAIQLGPTGAGMAGQFGAMTGMGAPEGMQFFAGIQRQYELTNAQIEQLIPGMFAAFARSGQDIQTFTGNWQEMLAQFDAGSAAMGEWTRAQELYEKSGMRATDRVSAAWQDLMTTMGNTQRITDAKNALADYFEAMIPTEVGRVRGLTRPEPITISDRLTIPPSDISAGIREQFGIQGFAGRMTAAEAERYEDLIQKWDAYFLEQGRFLEKQTITLVTEIGQPLKEIKGSAEASRMALEEMNERQKNAVYNWPSGAGGAVIIGQGALGGVALRQPQVDTTQERPWNQALVDSLIAGDVVKPPTETEKLIGEQKEEREIFLPMILKDLDMASDTTASALNILGQASQFAAISLYNIAFPEREWRGGGVGGGGGGGAGGVGGDVALRQPQAAPGPSPWTPHPIDWTNPWRIYQYGGTVPGPVGQPQVAVVHGGETITPPGQQSGMMPPVLLKTQIDVDGRKVAESSHYILGDKYMQASRAAFGSVGGLVSL